MFRFREQARFELMDLTVMFDGDSASAEAQVRVREANRTAVAERFTWRFEPDTDGWRLAEVPPCLEEADAE